MRSGFFFWLRVGLKGLTLYPAGDSFINGGRKAFFRPILLCLEEKEGERQSTL
jgi:hypothetical protein